MPVKYFKAENIKGDSYIRTVISAGIAFPFDEEASACTLVSKRKGLSAWSIAFAKEKHSTHCYSRRYVCTAGRLSI